VRLAATNATAQALVWENSEGGRYTRGVTGVSVYAALKRSSYCVAYSVDETLLPAMFFAGENFWASRKITYQNARLFVGVRLNIS
jgi:hypothetical protein